MAKKRKSSKKKSSGGKKGSGSGALQKIVARAKQIRGPDKKMEWKMAIKKASFHPNRKASCWYDKNDQVSIQKQVQQWLQCDKW